MWHAQYGGLAAVGNTSHHSVGHTHTHAGQHAIINITGSSDYKKNRCIKCIAWLRDCVILYVSVVRPLCCCCCCFAFCQCSCMRQPASPFSYSLYCNTFCTHIHYSYIIIDAIVAQPKTIISVIACHCIFNSYSHSRARTHILTITTGHTHSCLLVPSK